MSNTHIKMPDITPIIRYVGDGEQTEFEFPFPIFASEDLIVMLGGAEQSSGFTINGAGQSAGGSVTFDAAPALNTRVTIKRVLPLERLTDFLEGGDFSAAALNTELDYMMACLQQLERLSEAALRYPETESPAILDLPSKDQRSGKALGFDEQGNPVAVQSADSLPTTDFTAQGTGAVTRSLSAKLADKISVRDFGANGDGTADDTLAFQQALSAHDHIYVPPGTYRITAAIALKEGQSMIGAGQSSIIRAANTNFPVIDIQEGYVKLQSLRLENGSNGIRLSGQSRPCVQNTVRDVTIWGAQTGLLLDGLDDTQKPTYWNHFHNLLIAKPSVNGIHLTKSGTGDSPNANKFFDCRVYSLGASMTGCGILVEHGKYNNAFVDCETNLHTDAQACVRLGAGAEKTLLSNLYTETQAAINNVELLAGSKDTAILNLFSASAGAAIADSSGGSYTAFNAGYPLKNYLERSKVVDLTATRMRYDTVFIDEPGPATVNITGDVSYYLVSGFNGAVEIVLPDPNDLEGQELTFKKIDQTGNIVTIRETSETKNPDGRPVFLGGPNDYATLLSDGAKWMIKSSNRMAGNTRYYNGTGTYAIDMAVDIYLLSAFSGALTAQLPPADAPEAIGRAITIKKVDVSSNTISITEQGGNGADQNTQTLSGVYHAITLVSNSSQWYVLSRFTG